jgi:hypothetical protein
VHNLLNIFEPLIAVLQLNVSYTYNKPQKFCVQLLGFITAVAAPFVFFYTLLHTPYIVQNTHFTLHFLQKICIYAIFLLPLRDFSYTNGILV